MEPFITVIVIVYNRAKILEGCIESLMAQDYPREKIEIIVSDDGSTDNIEEIVTKYPVIWVKQPHKGMSAARNLGLKHANGEIVVFFDDDTVVDSGWIKNAIEIYTNYENVGGVTGKIKKVQVDKIKESVFGKLMGVYAKIFGISGFFVMQNGIGKVLPTGFTVTNFHELRDIKKVQILSGCNMSFRKKVMDEIGLFDEGYVSYYDDQDYSYRVFKKGYNLYATPFSIVDHLVTPVNREQLHKVKYNQLISQKRFFYKNVYEGRLIRKIRHILSHISLFLPILAYSIFKRDFRLIKGYLKAELNLKKNE